MNLVAKEYVASRVEDTGVLVLSRFAGAASELEGSCLVNPWDDEGTARTLDRALRMEVEEQRTRMIPMRRRVMRQDAVRWGQKFVEALGRVRSSRDRGMAAVSYLPLRATR
jgi:trehalose-6-phosphate synthase